MGESQARILRKKAARLARENKKKQDTRDGLLSMLRSYQSKLTYQKSQTRILLKKLNQ